jgi:hypothetical protein
LFSNPVRTELEGWTWPVAQENIGKSTRRLGYFMGHEDRMPFDYDEVVALIAPKPALIVAPSLDRYARVGDVRREMEPCKRVYELLGHRDALSFETPEDFNRFPPRVRERVVEWLARV